MTEQTTLCDELTKGGLLETREDIKTTIEHTVESILFPFQPIIVPPDGFVTDNDYLSAIAGYYQELVRNFPSVDPKANRFLDALRALTSREDPQGFDISEQFYHHINQALAILQPGMLVPTKLTMIIFGSCFDRHVINHSFASVIDSETPLVKMPLNIREAYYHYLGTLHDWARDTDDSFYDTMLYAILGTIDQVEEDPNKGISQMPHSKERAYVQSKDLDFSLLDELVTPDLREVARDALMADTNYDTTLSGEEVYSKVLYH